MANGVRSNRYVGSKGGGIPVPAGPNPGKAASALGDARGSVPRAIKSGKGGSTKKRKVSRKKARGGM